MVLCACRKSVEESGKLVEITSSQNRGRLNGLAQNWVLLTIARSTDHETYAAIGLTEEGVV
jgi:hypothetical protein